ncbi:MAG: MarC family protein [Parvibaculum sp.]|uniref:MarC family protein n=1 Tax=Parvibaculum sp. TaxID=2024848 RepID=UPI00284D7FCE|nr:MarC family protein [Parvibaculum sp.]MDR3500660.1 MarC family protein [Parvibaculum sp.]
MVNELVTFGLTALAGYFAIANPVSATPIFIALTAGDKPDVRRAIARNAVLTALAVVVGFSLAGKLIFEIFGITMAALRIAGGILVAIVGYQMLQGRSSSVQVPRQVEGEEAPEDIIKAQLSVAVSPLGMPIIAGPGTIATAVGFSAQPGFLYTAISIAAFAAISAVTYLMFMQAPRIVRFLGETNLTVVTRLMGLIVATVGVEMILTGVGDAMRDFLQSVQMLPMPRP